MQKSRGKVRPKISLLSSRKKAVLRELCVSSQGEYSSESSNRPQMGSDLGCYAVRGSPVRAILSPRVQKLHDAIQLATFSATELGERVKTQRQKGTHEAMLRKELGEFRGEIEQKFRQSHMNCVYRFPRAKPADTPENEEDDSCSCNLVLSSSSVVETRGASANGPIVSGDKFHPKSTHRTNSNYTRPAIEQEEKEADSPRAKVHVLKKQPFLMLSFRQPEKARPLNLRVMCTIKSGVDRALNFQRDLKDYIVKKDTCETVRVLTPELLPCSSRSRKPREEVATMALPSPNLQSSARQLAVVNMQEFFGGPAPRQRARQIDVMRLRLRLRLLSPSSAKSPLASPKTKTRVCPRIAVEARKIRVVSPRPGGGAADSP